MQMSGIKERVRRAPLAGIAVGVMSLLAACSGGGTGSGSGEPGPGGSGGGAAEGTPTPPTDLSVSVGDGTVTLSWSEVADATHYTLYLGTSPGVGPGHGQGTVGVESPLTQQVPFVGQTYYIALTASNGIGEGAISNEITVTLEGEPLAPTGLAATAGDASVELTWDDGVGASGTTLYWSTGPDVGPGNGSEIPGVTSPYTLPGLSNGTDYWFTLVSTNEWGQSATTSNVVTATPGQEQPGEYDPSWGFADPAEVITFTYDAGKTSQENGDLLEDVMEGLTAGQKLQIGAGTYTINPKVTLNLAGTEAAPIWIEPVPGEEVHITRDDQNQNTINIGEGFPTRYLALRNLEITWGDTAVRLYDCANVWIDGCHIHNFGGGGITANANDTDAITITRNEIHDSGNINEGEGMYLGANNGVRVMTNSTIALNHVYDTNGTQGDGIELKQGSYGNRIVENLVHDTNYPCILVYGTGGMEPFNVIERNVCYNSNDNVMQVQGEAHVVNNLCVNGGNAFFSNDHQGTSRDLDVRHNTFINSGNAVNLSDWDNRPGMRFANNVCYSQNATGLRFNGSTGVTVAGNVVLGGVSGVSSGYITGNGLSDFEGLAWDGTALNAKPTAGGAIPGAGDLSAWTILDLLGNARSLPADPGCMDAD